MANARKDTAANEATAQDGIHLELAHCIKSARMRFEAAQAKFLTDAQANPASAITWAAESMVKAQADHELWLRIERQIAEHDPREVLAAGIEDARYRVQAFFGSNSTSIFSNAVERARAEACLRQVEQLEGLLRHFGG